MATKRIDDFQSSVDYLILTDFNHFVKEVYQKNFDAEKRVALIMGILQRNGLPDVANLSFSNYAMIKHDLNDLIAHIATSATHQNLLNMYKLELLYLNSAVNPVDDGSISLNQKK